MRCFAVIPGAVFLYVLTSTFSAEKTIAVSAAAACDSIPELNKQIVGFVKTQVGKKVGRGECWDLASAALNSTGAKWDGLYVFGREVNYKKDCIYPGDVMQFENIEIKYQKGTTTYREEMTHHTAIIYEVKGEGNYVVAEQNTSMAGKKVSLDPLELKNIIKGKFKIYQPVK